MLHQGQPRRYNHLVQLVMQLGRIEWQVHSFVRSIIHEVALVNTLLHQKSLGVNVTYQLNHSNCAVWPTHALPGY